LKYCGYTGNSYPPGLGHNPSIIKAREKTPSICTDIMVRMECLSTSRVSALYIRKTFNAVIAVSSMGIKYRNSLVRKNKIIRNRNVKARNAG